MAKRGQNEGTKKSLKMTEFEEQFKEMLDKED